MQSILDSAHTWFLDSCAQYPGGELLINLVEGIKGTERLPVSVGDTVLGPYFPVTIEPHSRCAVVRFEHALTFFTFNESYDCAALELQGESSTVVRRIDKSAFREFAARVTTAEELGRAPVMEHLIWCEDQIFQVISSGPPEIELRQASPNFALERGRTWSAS